MIRLFFLLLMACVTLIQLSAAPNIIVLLADDLRADALGYAGNRIVQTPNLDRLASEGTVFRNAFVTTSICAVSRASIFAGQYARRTGIYDFSTRFSNEAWAECYPELLRKGGYRTGFIGKFGVGSSAPTNTFDYWDGFNGQGRYSAAKGTNHLTRRMGESARRFLTSDDPRPFCLSISFKAPHAQDGAAREFPPDAADEALYSNAQIPIAPSVSDEAFQKLPEPLQKSEGRTRWQRRFATAEMRERTVKDYYRLITGMDREIGRIRQVLREHGLDKNTIIIFTSDNGFYLGEHGLADKWFMHEESIRVPLLVYDPRAGGRSAHSDALVLNIDLAPTILDFAGVRAPERMQGHSLRPLLSGRAPDHWRREFFYEHHFPYGGRIPDTEGVRTARWKYIRYTSTEPLIEELFDLENDPFELTNLSKAPEHEMRLDALRERWRVLRAQAR